MTVGAPRRVLALYAHPDDAEIWAGGTLLLHRAAGDQLAICVLTHGDTERAEEARLGATRLGAALIQYSFPDRRLAADRETIAAVARVLRDLQPDVILTHWERDSHPDHVAVWLSTQAAILDAEIEAHVQAVFWSDTYNGLGTSGAFEPDSVVDVSAVWREKLEALDAHSSQHPETYAAMIDRQCGLHGARAGVNYAEGFRRAPLFGRVKRPLSTLWDAV